MTLQNWSYIAQIISTISLLSLPIIGWQLYVSIDDIRTRSRREAGTLAIAQADKFATLLLPELGALEDELAETGFKFRKVELVDFNNQELAKLNKNDLDSIKAFLECLDKNPEFNKKFIRIKNQIEAVAMSFVSGMADEEIVFGAISDVFCSFVEKYAMYIALRRKGDKSSNSSKNIIELYKVWHDRIRKIKIETQISKLEIEFKNIESQAIKPLGG